MSNPHITKTDSMPCVELSFCQSEQAFSDLLYFKMATSTLCAPLRDERTDDGGMEGNDTGCGQVVAIFMVS